MFNIGWLLYKDINSILSYIEWPIGIVSGALIFTAQFVYLRDTWLKKVKPSVLSWTGWALLMGTGLVSQILSTGWQWSHTGILISSIGCGFIGLTALITRHYSIDKRDWFFTFLGLICVLLYILSHNPMATTVYAISADFILGIPILIKTFKNPESEKSKAWYLGLVTWSLTLLIAFNHELIHALFPIYLFLFSVTMVYLLNRKRINRKNMTQIGSDKMS